MRTLNCIAAAIAASFILFGCVTAPSEPLYYDLTSPDGRLAVQMKIDSSISFRLFRDSTALVEMPCVSMTLDDGTVWGESSGTMLPLKDVRYESVDRFTDAPFHRNATVHENYNEADLVFEGFGVRLRVYDEGMAYRFYSRRSGSYSVTQENARFVLCGNPVLYKAWSNAARGMEYQCSFENRYEASLLDNTLRDSAMLTPVLARYDDVNVLICDCDIESYPGMFLKWDGQALNGSFAHVPEIVRTIEPRGQVVPVAYSDVIACCRGRRDFPWRAVGVGTDRELLSSDLCYMLGRPAEHRNARDAGWIVPGKAAWEWWNDWGIASDGTFEPGVNDETYRRYIDFAADYGLEYVVVDEGWSDPYDVMESVPSVDVQALAEYARSKGVGIILWCVGYVLDKDLDRAMKHYSEMGVRGFKVDFIDRDDQAAVEMVHRICDAALRHRMVLDLHGMYKPAGLNRTYPNVLNFEGVWGLEQMKWSDEDMVGQDVLFPFIRMWAGPVDYTQGAMDNRRAKDFVPDFSSPASQGTRARQVAEYVVFDSPLVMLCDSPDRYRADSACTRFIASIPACHDSTVVLGAELGKHIVVARKGGGGWVVGGINGWEPMVCRLDLSDILAPGVSCHAEVLRDSGSSWSRPSSYVMETMTVDSETVLNIRLAPGGGFAVRLAVNGD